MKQSKAGHRARFVPTELKWWIPALLLVGVLAAWAACGNDDYSSGSPSSPPSGKLELNSGDFGPGASYQHRFASAGTFPYHCVHHSPMTGSVNVSAGAVDTLVSVSITSSTSPFAAASVKPGGRVVWTNNTGMIHTVTSN